MISRKSEGLLFRYAPEDKDGGQQSQYSSLGVSGLLGGHSGPLIPVGNRRMARREEHEHAAEANGNGHADGNGHAMVNGNGHLKLNGNGHASGNGHSSALSLRVRAGVRADSDAESFSTLPIIDRLS